MNRRTTRLLTRVWYLARHYWPHTLLFIVVVALLWIAGALAIRSGLFSVSGKAPSSDQIKVFLAFVGGGLGTAATVYTALITREHNARERERLRLETVIRSLQSLPEDQGGPRAAGVLATMVLLGHERIGMRVLEPAWKTRLVDDATATWLIGQVMTGRPEHTGKIDEVAVNEAAVIEATSILRLHIDRLTADAEGSYNFPGPYLTKWRADKKVPYRAKDNLLLAMVDVLLSREPKWWAAEKEPPSFPTESLIDCLETERDQVIRSSAATLLEGLRGRYPDAYDDKFCPGHRDLVRTQAHEAKKGERLIPEYYLELAQYLREDWGRPTAEGKGTPSAAPNGELQRIS